MDITLSILCIQTDCYEKFINPLFNLFLALCQPMCSDSFCDDVLNFHLRVQGRIRILENNLRVLRELLALLTFQFVYIFSSVENFSICSVIQTKNCSSTCCLSAAGFSYDAKCLTRTNVERDIVNGF